MTNTTIKYTCCNDDITTTHTIDELYTALDKCISDMSMDEFVELYNEYVFQIGKAYKIIHFMHEFDNVMEGSITLSEVAELQYKNTYFDINDNYFVAINNEPVSSNNPYDLIGIYDISDIVTYIVDNNNTLNNLSIELYLIGYDQEV